MAKSCVAMTQRHLQAQPLRYFVTVRAMSCSLGRSCSTALPVKATAPPLPKSENEASPG